MRVWVRGLVGLLLVAVMGLTGCGAAADGGASGDGGSPSASASEPDPRLEIPEPTAPPRVRDPKNATEAARDTYLGYVTDEYTWALNTGFSNGLRMILPWAERDETAAHVITDLDRIRADDLVVTSDPVRIENQRCLPFERSQVGGYWLCQFDWTVDHIEVTTSAGDTTGHDDVTSTLRVVILVTPAEGFRISEWVVEGDLPSAVIP